MTINELVKNLCGIANVYPDATVNCITVKELIDDMQEIEEKNPNAIVEDIPTLIAYKRLRNGHIMEIKLSVG